MSRRRRSTAVLVAGIFGLAFAGGAAVGEIVGPFPDTDSHPPDDAHRAGVRGTSDGPDRHAGHDARGAASAAVAQADEPGTEEDDHVGHTVSDVAAPPADRSHGYVLAAEPLDASELSGDGSLFRFRIHRPDGTLLDDYAPHHERELHLVVVGRDLADYHHLHPTRGDDGTWVAELPPLAPGSYRAYADFVAVDGPAVTLDHDILVDGEARYAPLPEPERTDRVDGYVASVLGPLPIGDRAPDDPDANAGSTERVVVAVSRDDGEPAALEPYLGAEGHLVAIRSGDLAYRHAHPVTTGTGPEPVVFAFDDLRPGRYRLFFDFVADGRVRTATFTVDVPWPDPLTRGGR